MKTKNEKGNLCVGQTLPYTYMKFKDQKWSKGAHLEQTRFGREREEKRERELGLGRISVLGGISSHFLLLCDQATYKRRFEKIEGKKSNPSFPLCDF